MPIEYRIDAARRLVLARAHGTLTDQDVFGYQREVWSRPDVAGFDELVDMSGVEHIALPRPERVPELSRFSTRMDASPPGSKFAIHAPTDVAFGLGRMYQTYREMDSGGAKKVGVFRTLDEALAFLGVGREVLEIEGERRP